MCFYNLYVYCVANCIYTIERVANFIISTTTTHMFDLCFIVCDIITKHMFLFLQF